MLQLAPETFSSSSSLLRRAGLGYVCILALAALVPIVLVSFVNFAVDPFQFFRKAERPKFSMLMFRHQMPGIIRNYPFDAIVVGHSLAGNFVPEYFSNYKPEVAVQNLSLFGGSLNESTEVAKLALRKKPIKVVFWSLGYQNVKGNYRFPDFPHCMYSRWLEHVPACYLLNVDVLRQSLVALFGLQSVERGEWRDNLTRWQTYHEALLDLTEHACGAQRRLDSVDNIPAMMKLAEESLDPSPTPDGLRFSRLVLPVVDAYPDVKFVFFFPPIFVTEFWWEALAGHMLTQQFMKQELLKRGNVELFDFQAHRTLTQYPQFFHDLYHGNSGVASRMAFFFTDGRYRVTDLAQNKEDLRRAVHDAEPHLRSYFDWKCDAASK